MRIVPSIYCADIGSIAKNRFGWAHGNMSNGSLCVKRGTNISELVELVSSDITNKIPVALGFECPLFVPIPDDPVMLTSGRKGEGQRPWCAGAGAGSLATGLTETVWILKQIHKKVHVNCPVYFDWIPFYESGKGLFIWEAFVTSKAKGESHSADAEIAVRLFSINLDNIPAANAIHEESVHSLIGAALLRVGWSTDIELLGKPCIVLKA